VEPQGGTLPAPAGWPPHPPACCAAAAQVTLIDQSDRFVFKPLLYELLSGAASDDEVAPRFAQLLGPYPVTFLQGRVQSVQPEHEAQVGAAASSSPRCSLPAACWRSVPLSRPPNDPPPL
jgi:hypothetical protein